MMQPSMEGIDMSGIPTWLANPDPNVYLSDNYVTLDFETTNIEKGSPLVEAKHRACLLGWRRGYGQPVGHRAGHAPPSGGV